MITKRIIPCLDVKDGRVVKGVRFAGLADVSDPVSLARGYSSAGADELVFYDITASHEGRKLFADVLARTAAEVFIPLTVGGGISFLSDFERVLDNGADKVSVNSGASANPGLIGEAARRYGSQCVVLSVDAARVGDGWHVFATGGRIDTDGVKRGFDLPLLSAVCAFSSVPVVASGGAGCAEDFVTLFREIPRVDAGLAASIFHYGEVSIAELKARLSEAGINVRRTREEKTDV